MIVESSKMMSQDYRAGEALLPSGTLWRIEK